MARNPYPSELADRFIVRMPEGLRDRIAAAARASGRSMNAEIIQTLEEAYPPEATIEDVIEYAEEIADGYLEAPDYQGLRALREALKDVVAELKKGRREGFPEIPIERAERMSRPKKKPDSPKG